MPDSTVWTLHVGRGKGYVVPAKADLLAWEPILQAGARAMGLGRFSLRCNGKVVAYAETLMVCDIHQPDDLSCSCPRKLSQVVTWR